MSGPQSNPVMARLVEAALTPVLVIRFGQLRGTERTYLSVTQETHIQKFDHQLRFRHSKQILHREFGLGSHCPCLSSSPVCTCALMFRSVYSGSWLFLLNTTANALSWDSGEEPSLQPGVHGLFHALEVFYLQRTNPGSKNMGL